jgi:hypothetical protein
MISSPPDLRDESSRITPMRGKLPGWVTSLAIIGHHLGR